jgi:hypothetical protein
MGLTLLEERVGEGSRFAGQTVAEAGWHPGTVVATIQHGSRLPLPEPNITLQSGDLLSVLTHEESAGTLERELRGAASEEPETEEEGPDLIQLLLHACAACAAGPANSSRSLSEGRTSPQTKDARP